MNEVEKMYRNSGIKKHKKTMLDIETGKDVLTLDSFYPEFTAEKQLELIKWLSDISSYFSVHYDGYKGTYNVQTGAGGLYVTNNLSEAIASRINIIWNDLSEKQHTQIKEILE